MTTLLPPRFLQAIQNTIRPHRSRSHLMHQTPKKDTSCNIPAPTTQNRNWLIFASAATIPSVLNVPSTGCTKTTRCRLLVKPSSKFEGFWLRIRQNWTKLRLICWPAVIEARRWVENGASKVGRSKITWRRSWPTFATSSLKRKNN